MTDDDRETFLSIVDRLKWDAHWWVTILLIEKLVLPSSRLAFGYDSEWDSEIFREELHDAGMDD